MIITNKKTISKITVWRQKFDWSWSNHWITKQGLIALLLILCTIWYKYILFHLLIYRMKACCLSKSSSKSSASDSSSNKASRTVATILVVCTIASTLPGISNGLESSAHARIPSASTISALNKILIKTSINFFSTPFTLIFGNFLC